MSCESKEAYKQEGSTSEKEAHKQKSGKQKFSTQEEVFRTAKLQRIGMAIAVCLFGCVIMIQLSDFWRGQEKASSKENWEQMSGNDGKFWKGTPNEG